MKDSIFAQVVQELQQAIQRAQSTNQRGRTASSEEFGILKEAVNLQLGLAPAMNHALGEKETNVPAVHWWLRGFVKMGFVCG